MFATTISSTSNSKIDSATLNAISVEFRELEQKFAMVYNTSVSPYNFNIDWPTLSENLRLQAIDDIAKDDRSNKEKRMQPSKNYSLVSILRSVTLFYLKELDHLYKTFKLELDLCSSEFVCWISVKLEALNFIERLKLVELKVC